MSSEAALQRGKGVISNPAFFMILFIAGSMGLAGLLTVAVSGWLGWVLGAGTVGLLGLGVVVGRMYGDGERLFVILLAAFAAISWVASTAVVFHLWWSHENYIWAISLIVFSILLPVAVIMGERVMPILIAFASGVFGLFSLVVFFMVVFSSGT